MLLSTCWRRIWRYFSPQAQLELNVNVMREHLELFTYCCVTNRYHARERYEQISVSEVQCSHCKPHLVTLERLLDEIDSLDDELKEISTLKHIQNDGHIFSVCIHPAERTMSSNKLVALSLQHSK